MASVLALQCSTIWAIKTRKLGVGQFVEFILTREWVIDMCIFVASLLILFIRSPSKIFFLKFAKFSLDLCCIFAKTLPKFR